MFKYYFSIPFLFTCLLMLLVSIPVLSKTEIKSIKQSTYQVFSIESDNVKMVDNFFIYENDDIWILYDFWGPQGEFTMRIHNKTQKQLTIDWGKSQFINSNGLTLQYYNADVNINSNTNTTQIINSVSSGVSNSQSIYGAAGVSRGAYELLAGASESNTVSSVYGNTISSTSSNTRTVVHHPQRYLNIPADGDIIQAGFSICTEIFAPLDFPISNVEIDPVTMKFKRSNSPIKFTNNLSYSFEEGSVDVKTVISKFWICNVTNMFTKNFNGPKVKRRYHDIYGNISTREESLYPYAQPNSFYLYKAKPVDKMDVLKGMFCWFCAPPLTVISGLAVIAILVRIKSTN